MMRFAVFVLVVAATVAAQGPAGHDQAWEDYKLEFNKVYSAEEEPMRYANWKKDHEEVNLHNAFSGKGFTQAVNELSDLTDEEYNQWYLGNKIEAVEADNATLFVPSNDPLPNSVDWRQQGLVTGVKIQGQCGSCYAFSATGALEGAWKKKNGSLPVLSEQQIVDCSGRYHNAGCNGGRFENAWIYLTAFGGSESSRAYPYIDRRDKCHHKRRYIAATVSSFRYALGENRLTSALAQVGPIAVSIDALHNSFRRYRSGVYYDSACSSALNHAVLAVGYGTEGGHDYYLVKNSWGKRWGMGGYVKMARNRGNHCGIAKNAAYPIV